MQELPGASRIDSVSGLQRKLLSLSPFPCREDRKRRPAVDEAEFQVAAVHQLLETGVGIASLNRQPPALPVQRGPLASPSPNGVPARNPNGALPGWCLDTAVATAATHSRSIVRRSRSASRSTRPDSCLRSRSRRGSQLAVIVMGGQENVLGGVGDG
jgi:hypothetical protein